MITNKQKISLCIINFISLFLAIMAILPFSILADRLGFTVGNINNIEIIFKFIILPICIIGMSIYPMVLRKNNYYEQLDISVGTTKMTLMPIAMYGSSLLGWVGGVIYASISYLDSNYLFEITMVWCISVIAFCILGIFTKWMNTLTRKQMLFTYIFTIILFIVDIVSCFILYNELPTIGDVKENNAFLMIILYMCLFIISMVFLWKTIFADRTEPVVLEKNEEFIDEEVVEIITADIDLETKYDFEEYYENNRGKFIEEIKAKESEKNVEGN